MSQERPHFSFQVSTLDEDTFHVVRFTGSEGLSKLYQFDLTLISEKTDVDMSKALSGAAIFTIKREQGADLVWHGILRDFRQQQMVDNHVFYRAVLAPKTWQLTQTMHNRIFLNQDLTQNIRDCLTDGGLALGLDFALNITGSYPKREYVCQYNESHFDFVSRWMERNGLYFYFDQSGPQEKMELTDSLSIHTPHPAGEPLLYEQPSGLDANITGKAVSNFQCEQRRLPREVLLRDYNYRTPGQDIQGTALVSEAGAGKVYVHGGHLRSHRQATFLAGIRSEALRCRERVFFGESNAPFVQPGYIAPLENHYRSDFNQNYLVIEVKHEGSQESWLTAGMGAAGGGKLYYRNAFAAIPASVQFRSEVKTPKPSIEGVIKGVVDAEGSGKYAELDDQGRYKVIMPFDISGRKDGHASTWLRMVQPYAGQGHGMHFPLHKGTEVAILHYEGDPDRPMIVGALPNPLTQSVVTSDNQTMANITTSGGNRIHMEDMEGRERILLHSTPGGDFVRIGAPNDPGSGGGTEPAPAAPAASAAKPASPPTGFAGIVANTPGWLQIRAGALNSFIAGENTSVTVGLKNTTNMVVNTTCNIGANITLNVGGYTTFAPYYKEMRASVNEMNAEKAAVITTLTEFVGDANKTGLTLNEVLTEKTQNLVTLEQLIATKNAIGELTDETYATKSEMSDTKSVINSDLNELAVAVERTCATKTEMNDQVTSVASSVTKLEAECVRTGNTYTYVGTAHTVTSADSTTVSGTVSFL